MKIRVKRLVWLLTLIATTANAQITNDFLDKKIEVSVKKAKLSIFLELMEKNGIKLTYSPDQIHLNKEIIVPEQIDHVGALLKHILRDEGIEFKIVGDKILLIPKKSLVVSGIVKESGSGEAVANANIIVLGTDVSTATNAYGFYSIKLKPGSYHIMVSHVGMKPFLFHVMLLKENHRSDISLSTEMNLEPIYIRPDSTAGKKQARSIRGKQIDTEFANINLSANGDVDAIGSLQILPGVSGATSNTVGLFVRGGNSDQNMISIDDIPVFSLNHYFGLFSIISPEIIKSTNFFSNNFPSRYTGRISSVVDIRTRDGDMNKYHGQVAAGWYYVSGSVEGPIIKNRCSFVLSGRRSWQDLFFGSNWDGDPKYNFSDLNLKLNYVLDKNNRVYFTKYQGKDDYDANIPETESDIEQYRSKWGNNLMALRWNSVLSPITFKNTTFTISQYDTDTEISYKNIATSTLPLVSGLKEYSIKTDFSSYLKPTNKISYGLGANKTIFIGQNIKSSSSMFNTTAYIENEIDVGENYKLIAGMNYTHSSTDEHSYRSLQPRVSLSKLFETKHLVTASFSKISQFLYQLTQPLVLLENEIRIPSSNAAKPQHSYTYNILYRYFPSPTVTFSLEVYHKKMKNLAALRPGQSLQSGYIAGKPENALIQGDGLYKGLELQYNQKVDWLGIHLAYALSNGTLHFKNLNRSNRFPSNELGRHNLYSAMNAKIYKNFVLTSAFTLASGQKLTIPSAIYKNLTEVVEQDYGNLHPSYHLENVNSYSLPNEYRFDLGINHHTTLKNGNQINWSAGVNSLFSRIRPMDVFVDINKSTGIINISNSIDLQRTRPFVNLTFKFHGP